MKKLLATVATLGLLVAGGVGLLAQTISIPQVQNIGPSDLFQDIVGGMPSAQNQYATAAQIGTYPFTLAGSIDGNTLIGGDFSTGLNLWSYTTTPAAVNGTATYVANRWFAWGGGTSTLTVTQQTAAADVPSGSTGSMRVSRAGNGLTQVCVAQVIESINALPYQGQTAEFDVGQVKAGSTFSAASSNLAVYVLTGTGTDEGSSKAAFSINAGGGGASGWTGATLLGGTTGFLVPISTGFNRVSVAVPIAATATEIAVAVCYTPVGNGASTDWFEFTQAQFSANPALKTAAGTAGVALALNDLRAKDFQNRFPNVEQALQQRYAFSIQEFSTGVPTAFIPTGVLSSTTTCDLIVQFPVQMRTAPTVGPLAVLTTSTFRIQDSTTSTLAAPFIQNLTSNTAFVGSIRATLTTSSTAGWGCQLQGAGGAAYLLVNAEL